MLVLTRKQGQRLLIGGGIIVTVKKIRGNAVSIGVEAPPDVPVIRDELIKGNAVNWDELTRKAKP